MLFPAPPSKTIANADVCSTPRRSSRKHKPKVLIVEDHEDTREMLRTILEMKGCQVIEAGDGLEAVEQARRERPELILMDGSLPLLDGLQATRRIREDLPASRPSRAPLSPPWRQVVTNVSLSQLILNYWSAN